MVWEPKTLRYRIMMARRRAHTVRGAARTLLRFGAFADSRQLSLRALRMYPLSFKSWATLLLALARVRL